MVFKKIIFQNRYVALETPSSPPPFMANAILNFHFDFLKPSLKAFTAIFGECLNYKSGLRILIWPLEVPFFWSQSWALLAKVTIFGPQKMALRRAKTTFIVQTFPKYGPYDFYFMNLSLLGAILAIFQFCRFLGLFWPFFPCKKG